MSTKKVLFIGAHPDDIDLGCAISMHNHYLKKDEVINIVLTKGEKGGCSSQRSLEQINSFDILAPNSKNYFLSFPDTKLFGHIQEITNKLRSIILEVMPDIAYIPSQYDFHQDHVATHKCALTVLTNLGTLKIICYESPSTMPEFTPNYFKLCSLDNFSIKLDALKCHKTQMNKPYFYDDILLSIAKMRAAQVRCHSKVAEAYEIVRFVKL
ncbi:PIG-L deacetylase family protein [Herbivorax sp. ANBcel31]|uniref:PIG-L deacetylase family protein n=1 Tax=Herbivorax sp. ANBcel31 TaxID=3069754 RepID=UPI0027B4AC90|nr:PIG-L deacetylase family protein [Herbivorax sp. ANBcel31]MDQ2085560.1 PIG-L deacetylase family protein [Herbivorax sp. ANBcel31]